MYLDSTLLLSHYNHSFPVPGSGLCTDLAYTGHWEKSSIGNNGMERGTPIMQGVQELIYSWTSVLKLFNFWEGKWNQNQPSAPIKALDPDLGQNLTLQLGGDQIGSHSDVGQEEEPLPRGLERQKLNRKIRSEAKSIYNPCAWKALLAFSIDAHCDQLSDQKYL